MDDFNDIPVLYCKRCLSLLIGGDEFLGDYCMDCGCTDIGKAHIEEWEVLYAQKYKKKF